ncbi:MAG: pirin family protein [Caldilineaceae bacterium]|nr:pirin family protein [Caldilineaceae bacterium]
MGPAVSLTGRDIGQDFAWKDGWNMYHGEVVPGFPSHPHRGFETVTIVREGLVDHSDSMGAAGRYGNGDVQWLTTGAGVQHAEMFPLINQHQPNPLDLFQIWVNLPAQDKMTPPHFAMLWNQTIPRRSYKDGANGAATITVYAGSFDGMTAPSPPPASWASRPDSDFAIWTLQLPSNASFTLPPANAGTNRSLYFFSGSKLSINGHSIPPTSAAFVRADAALQIESGDIGAELLLLQGRPIGEPVAQHGPFVMNTRKQLIEAFADYQATQFGGWPWPNDDHTHPRDKKRFALHADGREEVPE